MGLSFFCVSMADRSSRREDSGQKSDNLVRSKAKPETSPCELALPHDRCRYNLSHLTEVFSCFVLRISFWYFEVKISSGPNQEFRNACLVSSFSDFVSQHNGVEPFYYDRGIVIG